VTLKREWDVTVAVLHTGDAVQNSINLDNAEQKAMEHTL
jgi:hypothetical protein